MTQQSEALRLADALEGSFPEAVASSAAAELRKQHNRIATLEAALRQAVEALEWASDARNCPTAIAIAKQALGDKA